MASKSDGGFAGKNFRLYQLNISSKCLFYLKSALSSDRTLIGLEFKRWLSMMLNSLPISTYSGSVDIKIMFFFSSKNAPSEDWNHDAKTNWVLDASVSKSSSVFTCFSFDSPRSLLSDFRMLYCCN
jgi:hypothetical protein